jgi:hypothetical protein
MIWDKYQFKENKTFSTFKKDNKLNKIELEQTLNIRVDDAFRLLHGIKYTRRVYR